VKKIYLLAATLALSVAASAQSQRLVMVEEFTQASCGPCAAQNPAFNALVALNPTKMITIKYQTSWPGVDPMNAQNPTDVATRVSYYNVQGVPNAIMDGNVVNGAPSAITQTNINSEYAVPSPFTIAVSHTFNSNNDSIFITATITASQAFTSNGALKAHIVMVEQEINFANAPGSNGETDFYSVCRKMYPSAAGTTLPGTWANAATQTITIAAPVPNYIYGMNEVGIVCFIQQDGNKNVLQSGYSSPLLLPVDASASAVTGVPSLTCANTISPVVTLTNDGVNTLTSCDIEYQIDANTPATYNWTGSLASGGTATINLPAITVTSGSHTLTVTSLLPNGVLDVNTNNDSQLSTFTCLPGVGVAPYTNNISTTGFPYSGWSLSPASGDTWTRVTTNTGSLKFDAYMFGAGTSAEFSVEPVDFSTATAASIRFDVAHKQYSAAESDELEVFVSTDCGVTWTSVWSKAGATLSTSAGFVTTAFTPTASQWRTECIDLSSYVGQNKVFVKFVGLSDYGNNIYVDNINLNTNSCASGIEEGVSLLSPITLFPNPANESVTVNFLLVDKSNVVVNVYNTLGELVSTENKGNMSVGQQTIAISTEVLANGMYTVELVAGENKSVSRLSVSH